MGADKRLELQNEPAEHKLGLDMPSSGQNRPMPHRRQSEREVLFTEGL